MSNIVANVPAPPCSSLLFEGEIAESQTLAPDPFSPRARGARGHFAAGHSGNPRGRPPGIPNPQRRIPDLRLRPLSAAALAALLDRKPHLLRPLALQLLPPPLPPPDPAERLGIDLSALRSAEDLQGLIRRLWTALGRGEISPHEAARVARRGRVRLRELRRLARLQRRLRLTAGANPR